MKCGLGIFRLHVNVIIKMMKLKLVNFKLGKETAWVKNRLLGQRICKT